jgi:hypothetical protein
MRAQADAEGANGRIAPAEAAWCEAYAVQAALQGQVAQAAAAVAALDAESAAGASTAGSRGGDGGPAVGSPAGGGAARRAGAYDAAVAALGELDGQGQLPGTFYGRLCNVLRLSGGETEGAVVNAVLQEVRVGALAAGSGE